jgi:hypothetical protein
MLGFSQRLALANTNFEAVVGKPPGGSTGQCFFYFGMFVTGSPDIPPSPSRPDLKIRDQEPQINAISAGLLNQNLLLGRVIVEGSRTIADPGLLVENLLGRQGGNIDIVSVVGRTTNGVVHISTLAKDEVGQIHVADSSLVGGERPYVPDFFATLFQPGPLEAYATIQLPGDPTQLLPGGSGLLTTENSSIQLRYNLNRPLILFAL